jgi:HAE1 family hydrophobic/amphiphilic exporter-1
MIPIGAIAEVQETVGPSIVTRYNVYPAARLMITPAPRVTTGQAIALSDQMAAATLPSGFVMEWTELALQETKAGSPIAVFLLAAVLVYLALAAQYESWTLPVSVLLAIPAALLGAVAMLMLRGMDNNVYTQIGLVLLIGLSAKGSILIVEFAKEKRTHGLSTRDAAVEAARLRLRAIIMTALAFILGVVPLLASTGAGAESRKAIGAAVFGGMIAATLGSLLFVPALYFVVQRTAEILRPPRAAGAAPAGGPSPSERTPN